MASPTPSVVITIPDPTSDFAVNVQDILAPYQGRQLAIRQLHIARAFPTTSWGRSAGSDALQVIRMLGDITLFQEALVELHVEPSDDDKAFMDAAALSALEKKATLFEQLLNNGEDPRATQTLADFLSGTGEPVEALHLYQQMSPEEPPSQDAISELIAILQVIVDHSLYATEIGKQVLDIDEFVLASKSQILNARSTLSSTRAPETKEELAFHSKVHQAESLLDLLEGLKQLVRGDFEQAAECLLRFADRACDSKDSTVLGLSYCSWADLALYVTISALMAFPAERIEEKILRSSSLCEHLIVPPFLRRALHYFMTDNIRGLSQYLENLQFRLLLDFHIGPHVPSLLEPIRDRSLLFLIGTFRKAKVEWLAERAGILLIEMDSWLIRLEEEGYVVRSEEGGTVTISLAKPV